MLLLVAVACSPQEEFLNWWRNRAEGGAADSALQKKLAQIAKVGKERHHIDVHNAAWNGNAVYVARFLELDPELVHAVDETEFGVRSQLVQ